MATPDNPLEIEYLPRVLPAEHRVGIRVSDALGHPTGFDGCSERDARVKPSGCAVDLKVGG